MPLCLTVTLRVLCLTVTLQYATLPDSDTVLGLLVPVMMPTEWGDEHVQSVPFPHGKQSHQLLRPLPFCSSHCFNSTTSRLYTVGKSCPWNSFHFQVKTLTLEYLCHFGKKNRKSSFTAPKPWVGLSRFTVLEGGVQMPGK